MEATFTPVLRQSLSDDIAQRISQLILSGEFEVGRRLPSISAMARQFGVGSPTLREALAKLETIGVVDIRHGSGVYVGRLPDSMLISNPVFEAAPSKALLVDLIDARIPIEVQTAALAVRNGTPEHMAEMARLLAVAGQSFDDSTQLNQVNLAFHRQIALASGNVVMHQILDVLGSLFRQEQRLILDIHGNRAEDHAEHLGICDALCLRNEGLAVSRMREHLERVRDMLQRWDPIQHPVE
ncbi:MAG: FadR family transcriptional regulator [Gemmatimonadaceae bacterium]|nr:FadR family transcriptional regulator [Gemmatimonadaceae bacterium]